MNSTKKRLLKLQVTDVMASDVVTVSANSTMSEAADVMSERQVTGAPVVDQQGRCIGVLSGSDYVHSRAAVLDSPGTSGELALHAAPCRCRTEEEIHDLVRRHMTPAVQTIDSGCSLMEAARCMVEKHIHRLIVIDNNCVPIGVLTSLGLVSAWIDAVEE